MTAAGASAPRGDAMYSQAATHSLADVHGAPYADQSYKPGDWMERGESSKRRSKMIVCGIPHVIA